MKRRFPVLVALVGGLALAACREAVAPQTPERAASPAARVHRAGGPSVPGQYIVVFSDDAPDAPALAQTLVAAHGGTLRYTYRSALRGFAAGLSDGAVAALARHPQVAWIEEDQEIRLDATQTMDANGDPWGLDRIDQRALLLSRTYTYAATGSGVNAYIIDTGIWTMHAQFGGRATNVYDAIGVTGEDCHGHGTHVAGTIGAATWGIAKSVNLRGVRVLSCAGLGLTSQIIAGVDWVRANHVKPAVANLSLGGGFSAAMNTAVNNLAAAGVFVAVAAGNDNADACGFSPAGASGVFTVASSTNTDAKSSFSSWGSCVEAYAPGSAIKSTWLLGGTNTISGTSMASPHVAGVAVLYKSTFGDASQSTVANWIISNATTGVITGNPAGTPNRLLFKGTL